MPQVGNVTVEKVGEPVPCAVTGDRRSLPPEAAKEIHQLMRMEPGRFLLTLGTTWLLMAAAIAAAIYFERIWVSILAIIFVGTRQNILGVLLHEQVHRTAFKTRWGDWLTNFTVAYPLGITLEGYRKVHLAHHQHFFTDKDPDFARKQGYDWTFPQLAMHLAFTFVKDLLALNLWYTIKSKRMEDQVHGQDAVKKSGPPAWVQPVFYLAIAGILTLVNGWVPFLLYWALPWATVLQGIVRWAAICEHRYNLIHPSVVESTPMIMLHWWERLILPNLNFTTYHIYHHYYPKVPWSKLPVVHDVFRREGLVQEENIFRGYPAFIRYLVQKPVVKQVTAPVESPDHTDVPPSEIAAEHPIEDSVEQHA